MSNLKITFRGRDLSKANTWKVIVTSGTREAKNLKARHVTGLSQAVAESLTPEAAWTYVL